jgi:hypothetical protein
MKGHNQAHLFENDKPGFPRSINQLTWVA